MRTKLSRSLITVPDRFRKDYGDLTDLCTSIKTYGLIQPLIVNQDNVLVAGGRRITACDKLGLQEIDVCYRETLSEEERLELEIEENLHRKDFHWIERVFAIETLHNLRKKKGALEGIGWTQKQTAELLGLDAACTVNYALVIADKLRAEEPTGSYHKCDNMWQAWCLRLEEEEKGLLAESAKQTFAEAERQRVAARLQKPLCHVCNGKCGGHDSDGYLLPCPHCGLSGYEPDAPSDSSLDSDGLEDLMAPVEVVPDQLSLTSCLYKGDCIDFMLKHPAFCDHIITDPPYAIDMSMLEQQNTGMDVSSVAAEHEVEPNKELLARFFPAAFGALKENGFCITWCDQMLWQYMYDLATSAGFKVQRWPITWVKSHHCMNQSANQNFTKTTEIAMVCRKGIALMVEKDVPSHILASHDEFKDTLQHPFVKPFAIWEHLIKSVTLENQLILEPFAGRGSGVLSIIRLKRRFFACESNEAHFNALLENLKQHYLNINPKFTFI